MLRSDGGGAGWRAMVDPMFAQAGIDPASIQYAEAGNSWGQVLAQGKGDAALSWEGLRAQWKGQGLDFDYLLGRSFSKFPANTFVNIDAKILGKDMKPLDERAKPKLTLTPPRGALEKDQTLDMGKKLSTAEGWTGTFTTRFLAKTPGEYQYKIEVPETGDSETGKFVIKESNPELDNTRPDFEQLWELASEAEDHLMNIKDEETRRLVKETLTRPRPVSADASEKKADAKVEDRPRFLFDLKNAEMIPDCVRSDYREQRSRGAADDWWDDGFPTDKPKSQRWFSWVLALVVALLSAEWLARKLLRLA